MPSKQTGRTQRPRRPRAATSPGIRRKALPCSRSTPLRIPRNRPRPPRLRPLHARPLCLDVYRPAVDDPPICGLLDRRGIERLLPPQPCRGAEGLVVAFDLATHRGYDCDHPRVAAMSARRASRSTRCRHENPVRRHSARRNERVDDHERRGDPVMAFYIVAAEEQGVTQTSSRDHPERHPEGVHGPQHLHLPTRTQHADRR